jgi:AcrR family transcriptional regulator
MAAAATTQDKLLDAAARLFAERGIENVSIAEIVRSAGQRNTSALHYHFGSRDGVLIALLERHIPDIRTRRLELLELARSRPDDEPRSAAEAVVRPITEFARRGWRERAYLRYGSDLANSLDRASPAVRELLRDTSGYEAWDLLQARCPGVPEALWAERMAICTAFIGRAAADRATQLDRGDARSLLPDDVWVDNLVDMVLGAMTAPVAAGRRDGHRDGHRDGRADASRPVRRRPA